ncbi:MAG: SsrA-binding protein SmpB [Elusimicrobiota bacterium]
MAKKPQKTDRILIATNRKARFHYEILEDFEAGIELKGPEVKSLRDRKVSFEGTYARVEDTGIFLHKLYIAPYPQNTLEDIPPTRTRKLLLHKREIRRLKEEQDSRRLTIVVLEIYFRRGWAKIRIALARGKKHADKRDSLRKKDAAREMERSFKGKFKR